MKGRNFSLILYEDSTIYNFNEVISKAINMCNNNGWSYYYILHNEDIKENGEKDKPHYHFIIIINSKESDTTINNISKFIGLPTNYIEKQSKPKFMILYLAHQSPNSKEKYNYDWHNIETNNLKKLEEVFNSDEEQRNIYAIIDYIDSIGYITFIDFSKFILNNNLWSYYRRSGAIINNLIKEHNNRYVKYKNKDDFVVDDF